VSGLSGRSRAIGIGAGLLAVAIAAAVAWKVRDELAVRADAAEARRLMTLGRFDEARVHLDRWARARPDSGEVVFLVARGALDQNLEEGFRLLDRAEALGYPREQVARCRGLTLLRMGRRHEAAPILRGVVFGSTKPDPEAVEALARSYLETFQLQAAATAIARWMEDAPNDPKPFLWRAEVGKRLSAEDQSLIDDYKAALRLDPKCVEAMRNLGEKALAAHRTSEARAYFDDCLALAPDDPEARLGLGRCLAELGDDDAAIASLDRAARLAPRDSRPLVERARLAIRRGEADASLALADRAAALDPSDPEIHYLRALALGRLGRESEATAEQVVTARLRLEKEDLAKILQSLNASPEDVKLQVEAARWLFDHGHPEEGLRWAEKILRERPLHPEMNRLLASYHESRGEAGLAQVYKLRAGAAPANP
jgi:tetratricopeptide (TPR) repeat protein